MNAASRNPKQTQLARERKYRTKLIVMMSVFSILGIMLCGYGYAAVSTDLLVSGEAKVKRASDNFTSDYMQDVTPEECSAVTSGAEKQLIDKRDGQSYWVSKIGNYCVMVQDLRLTLTTEGLDSRLSDINYSDTAQYEEETIGGQTIYKWNENSKYPPSNVQYRTNIGSSGTTTKSVDLGEYAFKRSDAVSNCGNQTSLSRCVNQLIYVGAEWETNETTGEEEMVSPPYSQDWSYTETGATYDEEGRRYDAHFLVGIYYQFMAATAGSYVAVSGIPTSSVCPRGWRLPLFEEMNAANTEKEQIIGRTLVTEAPFYLVRTGYMGGTYISSLGTYGQRWQREARGTSNVNIIYTSGTAGITAPATSAVVASRALTMRCIVRTVDEEE